MNAVVGAQQPGMSGVLDQMGRQAAALIQANQAATNALSTFMGTHGMHGTAANRMRATAKLLGKLTNIPHYLTEFAKNNRMPKSELSAMWQEVCRMVSGEVSSSTLQQAGMGGSYDSMDLSVVGFPQSPQEEFNAKYQQMLYLTSGLATGSPQFAQEMVMNAIIPIAKQIIPNTVFTKAFITDQCVGQISKPYAKKKRIKAYQTGLTHDIATLQPHEILDYELLQVTPFPFERGVRTDMKWIETMNFDVPADTLSDGGREMQVTIDTTAFAGLDLLLPNGATPGSGSTTNGFTLDATGTVMMLENQLNPQVEHLNAANQILRNRGYNPDLIITSPFELGQLMSQQAVLMAYAYGTREVQETGLVGTLVGNAVAWTPNLYQGGNPSSLVLYVVDSDELARTVLGWPISLFPDFHQRKLDFLLYTRMALFFRNVNACIKIVCANSDQGIT